METLSEEAKTFYSTRILFFRQNKRNYKVMITYYNKGQSMIRKFFLILSLFVYATAYSQQASIYGIPFGSSFSTVEKILDQKMFAGKYITPDYSVLEYHDANMAGIIFGSLIISFQHTGNDIIMTKATFSNCYKTNVTQLKKDRDFLAQKLSRKYSYIHSYISDIGFKSYEFGFSRNYKVGTLKVIILEKSQSNFGADYYYLDLEYAPKPSDESDL